MENDQDLDRLRSGDQTLFSELVRDHHRALVALATTIVGVNEAEEVVQCAWLKAFKAIASFAGKASIRTWLSRIVINEAKMQLRSRKKERLSADLAVDCEDNHALADRFDHKGHWRQPPGSWHFDSPEELLIGATLEDCLERLLAAMPAGQRAVLEMRDSGDLPFDEICNTLAISASNARVLLHRARTQVFNLVDHFQETGEC